MKELSCPQCNSPNPASAKFCYKCGALLALPQSGNGDKKAFRTPRVQFWLMTIALGVLFLILCAGSIWYLVGLNGQIADFSPEIERIRNLRGPEFTYSGRISDRDLKDLLPVAQSYTNPRIRPLGEETISPDLLLANPSRYLNRTVTVIGRVSRNAEVEILLEKDWPVAYVLGVWANGKEVPVIYRGSTKRFGPGDFIQVEGVFIGEGKGIHADKILRLAGDPQLQTLERLWILRASMAVFLWLVFCTTVFLWLAFRKNWFGRSMVASLVSLVLISVILSSCTMDVTTIVHPDGSSVMTTSLSRSKEDIDFLRQAPGMAGYLDSWLMNLRQEGMLAENSLNGDQESFFLQREFGSLDELSASQLEQGASWMYATKYIEGNRLIYRIMALVDTTVLYSNLAGLHSSAASEIQKELDSMAMSYSFVLPGAVTYHNGNLIRNNRVVWDLRLNDKNEIIVESQLDLPSTADDSTSNRWEILLDLALIAIASNLILIFSLIHYRTPGRKKQ